MANNTSTVNFRSNLYPINGSFFDDYNFHSKIHDIFSLKIFKDEMVSKKRASMTSLQEQEYRNASIHCYHADPDDYPFGTINDDAGCEKVVCKCLKTTCHRFKLCRPNFNPDELSVLDENKKVQLIIFEFENVATQVEEKNDSPIPEQKKFPEEKPLVMRESSIEQPPVISKKPVTSSKPTEIKKIGFDSFSETTQENIIEAEPEERSIINAAPGTGKTWTLIEKIIYMLNTEKVTAKEILVLCFSRSATAIIKNRLIEAATNKRIGDDWKDVEVRTFDSFATYMLVWLQDNNSELLPQPFVLEENDYEQRIKIAASVFEKTKEMLASYKHIIVDEVQDLVGSRAELVIAMLKSLLDTCGFTILGDSCQALYDYLSEEDSAVMSSEKFYKKIFSSFANANYYSLSENCRQNDELKDLSIPYREAILNGSLTECVSVANDLLSNIKHLPIKLLEFNLDVANKYKGTLGILTRTNGQALQISAWLRTNGVSHSLKRGVSSQILGSWIAQIFYDCKNDTIDENEFITLYQTHFPTDSNDVAKEHWLALISTQRKTKMRYEISDLLKGLLKNARDPLLYESSTNKDCAITVSNIHRAKGKEFDSVIVLDDVIENMTNLENKNVFEHKVCYVALTRPKGKIERAQIRTSDKQIYITKNEDQSNRCSKARIRNKKSISHFEVGNDTDLDTKSFADDENIQRYIQKNIRSGMCLKLIKCSEGTKCTKGTKYVVYKIVLEENPNIVLGYTSKSFARELEKAMQHIMGINCSVYHRVYPNTFCEVYVHDTATYISTTAPVPAGAKTFGDINIWLGITITGFAQVDIDTY